MLTRIASPPVESPMLEDPLAEQAAAVWRLLEAARRVALAGLALDDVVAALVDQATALAAADSGSFELADQAESRSARPRIRDGAHLTVPLVVKAEEVGRLRLWWGRPYLPDEQEVWPVRVLCEQVAPLIVAARQVERAGEALAARDAIVSAATHDLKSPLAAIRVRVEVLQEEARAATLDAEQLGSGLARIAFSAARIERLAGTVLDLTRAQSGGSLRLDREPVELVALARRLVEEQQSTTVRHDLRVEASVERLVGEWDLERLERAVSGLLTNALRYSPRGGEIVLTIDQEPGDAGGDAIVRVIDRGIGVAADEIPHMFDLFFRGKNAEHTPGSGVGLADVHQIVTAHGGTVSVASVEGAGSAFTVVLPRGLPAPDDGD
ncbi:MAG TPA: HAMP domain-containing sensor histidine kinase [Chloroflexota bacterium]